MLFFSEEMSYAKFFAVLVLQLLQIAALASFKAGELTGKVYYGFIRPYVLPVAAEILVALGDLLKWLFAKAVHIAAVEIRRRKASKAVALLPAASVTTVIEDVWAGEVAPFCVIPDAVPAPRAQLLLPAARVEEQLALPIEENATFVAISPESLKVQYGSFKAAKAALGLKARSWAELADKLNS